MTIQIYQGQLVLPGNEKKIVSHYNKIDIARCFCVVVLARDTHYWDPSPHHESRQKLPIDCDI